MPSFHQNRRLLNPSKQSSSGEVGKKLHALMAWAVYEEAMTAIDNAYKTNPPFNNEELLVDISDAEKVRLEQIAQNYNA